MGFFDRFRGFNPPSDMPKVPEKSAEKNRREMLLSELDKHEIFTDQDKVYLLLVLEGLKSVCDVEIVNPHRECYREGSERAQTN